MKRIFDIVCASLGLVMLLPLLLIVGAVIKLHDHGPVFFAQVRVGRNGRPFRLFKFRTMAAGSERKGLPITAGGDPRVTRPGSFLRKTKMDELPQLWNVVKGDMSLVGPRPEVRKYVSLYREEFRNILSIRPGITDPSSLRYRNEEECLKGKQDPEAYYANVLLPEKLRLARKYARKASMVYDLKLILLTVFSLLYPRKKAASLIEALSARRNAVVTGAHLFLFIVADYLAFYTRFDGDIPPEMLTSFLKYLPIVVGARLLFLFAFSLDKGLWRYSGFMDLLNIAFSVFSGTLVYLVFVKYLLLEPLYPGSVVALDTLYNIFLLGGIRLLRRLHDMSGLRRGSKKRVILVGAGECADMLIREMAQNPDYPYHITGLVDDDARKTGQRIRNIPILGTSKRLPEIVEAEEPEEFFIAGPSVGAEKIKDLMKDLRQFGLPVKMVPGLMDILKGKLTPIDIKDVDPEDILFRPQVQHGGPELREFFQGKRVMVTGAGGSIGSELSRQLASLGPDVIVLFERHEESLFKIDLELKGAGMPGGVNVVSVIGDILDEKRVAEVMEVYRPEIVLHAAAYKHVPLMEANSSEALRNNCVGTRVVAGKAREYGAERFVLISTDKAVNPVNVMGRSKKLAEEIVRRLDREAKGEGTRNIIVRFGNVLGSTGSVVPIFRDQIRKGGPVTVTHPDMTRYLITIPEAVSLVLQAVLLGEGGEVFVLDMGEPVRILDLARRMISLYSIDGGTDIVFTGLRPGERLNEELFNDDERVEPTAHPKIRKAMPTGKVGAGITEALPRAGAEAFGFASEEGTAAGL